MSPNKDHFITYKASEGQECKGIAAGLKIKGRGTLNFRIDDDNEITHTINVPNYVHILYLPMVLVSPQHLSQQTSDGTKSTSGAKITILTFRGYRKTIQYSAHSNTPSFFPLPGRCATNIFWQCLSTGIRHLKPSSAPSMFLLKMNHHPQRERQRGTPSSTMDMIQMKSSPCLIERG